MAELDKILQKYVGHETEETLGVVRGAAFIVKDKQGRRRSYPPMPSQPLPDLTYSCAI